MRRWLICAACVLLLGSSLAVSALIHADMVYQLRGVEYPLTADLPLRIPRLGINADLLQIESDQLTQQLQAMQTAHITWIRQIVDWSQLEAQRGQTDWTSWDNLFQTLKEYPDLQLVPVFYRSPTWVVSQQFRYHPTLPPDDPTLFADFVRAFAQRYGDQITYYQIWDEPNLYEAWGQTNPQSTQYLALLAAAFSAVHAVDPQAVVIAAALAPTTETSGRNISDWLYLQQLYQLGLADVSDAVAAKPYGFNTPPTDRTVAADTLNFSRMVGLREIMREFDDSQTALWLSEWGWNALPSNWQANPSIWGSVRKNEQTAYTLAALDRIEREMPYIGGVVLSEWQPQRPPDDPRWGFALRTPADLPTPLYTALTSRPVSSVPSNGWYAVTDGAARYSGLWSFGALGADIGWLETTDSQLTLDFRGRDIGLRLRQGDYVAFLYPTINDHPANAAQLDSSGQSYIFLRSDNQIAEVSNVPVASNLPLTTHRLRIIADKGWDQWALVGFAVSDGDLSLPYRQMFFVSQLAVLVSGLTAIASLMSAGWPVLRQQVKWPPFISRFNYGLVSIIASIALTFGMLLSFGDGTPHVLRRDALPQIIAVVLSGGLLAFEWPFLLVLLACLILFIIFYHYPFIGIALTLLYAPFFLFPVQLYQFAFPVSELLLLLTFTAGSLRAIVRISRTWQTHVSQFRLRLPFVWHSFDSAAAVYLVLGFIAFFASADRSRAFTELRTLLIEPVLLYALIRVFVPRDQLHMLLKALLTSAVGVCVIGLVLYGRGEAVITAEEGARRLSSVYGSPNNVVLLLERCLPFALAYAWYTPRTSTKFLYAGLATLFLVTALLTQSTGGLLLGIPVSLAVMLFMVNRRRALIPLIALGTLLTLTALGLAQVSARFAKVLSFTEGTNFIRLRVWESALTMLRDQPLTGIGLDQFLGLYRGTYVKPDAIWDSQLNHPHNIILDVWLRLGLLGIVWLIGVQWLFWRTTFRLLASSTVSVRPLILGAGGAMAATLAHGLVDNSLFVQDIALIFWLLLAVLAQCESSQN